MMVPLSQARVCLCALQIKKNNKNTFTQVTIGGIYAGIYTVYVYIFLNLLYILRYCVVFQRYLFNLSGTCSIFRLKSFTFL